jgi:hypothetical protein
MISKLIKKAGLKKSRRKNAKPLTIELSNPQIEVEFVQFEVKIAANLTE